MLVVLFNHIDQILDKTILGFKEIQAIAQTLNALIARLMTHKKISVNQIATYIKIFLSTCYFFEKNTFTENDKIFHFGIIKVILFRYLVYLVKLSNSDQFINIGKELESDSFKLQKKL